MTTTRKTWLDKLPAPVRHMLIMSAGILLAWASTQITFLPAPLPELLGLVLGMSTLYLTKITKQYGLGKE